MFTRPLLPDYTGLLVVDVERCSPDCFSLIILDAWLMWRGVHQTASPWLYWTPGWCGEVFTRPLLPDCTGRLVVDVERCSPDRFSLIVLDAWLMWRGVHQTASPWLYWTSGGWCGEVFTRPLLPDYAGRLVVDVNDLLFFLSWTSVLSCHFLPNQLIKQIFV